MAELLLGVDAGQSGVRAAIADAEGRVRGVGEGGPTDHTGTRTGRRQFLASLKEALDLAKKAAGLSRGCRFQAACLGLSGGVNETRRSLAKRLVPADKLILTTDAEIALEGATEGVPGIVVIAGTGSIAYGRNARGERARAGGWGYLFGDEGGGFDIVRQALRAALRAEEGWGQKTILAEKLVAAAGCRTVYDVMHAFYGGCWPRDRIASLMPLVSEAAEAGDAVAAKILEDAGRALSKLALVVRRRLFKQPEQPLVTYTGGVFRCPRVTAAFLAHLKAEPARRTPLEGAVLIAMRAARGEQLG